MNIVTVRDYRALSGMAAGIIASQVNRKPNCVLGLATGSTPIGTYENLVDMFREGVVDFSKVTTFNLDEYCGLDEENPQSYHYFMREHLFGHVNVPEDGVHIPNGMAADVEKECGEYDEAIKRAGGIDLQLLGIGHNGHIGFNEPDDVFHDNTGMVRLTPSTIEANKRFFDRVEDVPKTAVSMGIGTIMAAREVLVLAGPDKAEIVEKLREESCSPRVPASILRYHPRCTLLFATAK